MKIICAKMKSIFTIACFLCFSVMLGFAVSFVNAGTIYFGYAYRLVPIYSVEMAEKKVALTFDAAWGSDKTQKIVDILSENGVKGTFFLVGFWVEANADKVKMIDEAGFDIGTHSSTHPKMSTLSGEQIEKELSSSMNLITNITGKKVEFFRPPYGDYNDTLINVAGCVVAGPVEKIEMSEVRRQFDVNVFGHIELAQNLVEIMEGGKIRSRRADRKVLQCRRPVSDDPGDTSRSFL